MRFLAVTQGRAELKPEAEASAWPIPVLGTTKTGVDLEEIGFGFLFSPKERNLREIPIRGESRKRIRARSKAEGAGASTV